VDLVLGSRFVACFFMGGVVPNPIDIRFQKVSGLSATMEMATVNEGGQNLYSHRLPRRVGHGNLILERGFVVAGSPLNHEFDAAMSMFQFAPCNVMITLLDGTAAPLAAWMFLKAFPVRWETANLDASEDRVLIDTLELSYASMQAMRV
jgi:phage tail-like protein